jgi:hypothetical protein
MPAPDTLAFVAGGTVQAGGGVYLERAADHVLLEHCRRGDFTYILTSRQMGKSSLMIRTAERLAAEGVRPAIVDLTELGAQTTAEQWYKGFLFSVEDQLGLAASASKWWDAHAELSIAHRFARYFREVVLAERQERIVVFVDEIDTTLRLDFTDDFFAAVRFLYQGRANDPALQRLSFVLIGVATPGDLIKDSARTPFNIGSRIELGDFTLDEALPLASHLSVPPSLGRDLVGWILRWTGGHPYLTLRVVRSLAESPPEEWTDAAISERVSALFFSAQGENDSNLQFVRDMLTKKAFNREAVLRVYYNIRRGERVPDKELDQVTAWLKLSGVVCRRDGVLEVRNAIYEHVFQKQWARDHLALYVNWRRRLARVALALIVLVALVTGPLGVLAWYQKGQADQRAGEAERQRQEADRQRTVAEKNLNDAVATVEALRAALAELKRYDPKGAAQISAQVMGERDRALKEIEARTAGLRQERDDFRTKAAALQAENSRLRESLTKPSQTAQSATVPDMNGRSVADARASLERSGLRVGAIQQRESSQQRDGTVLSQSPAPGTSVQRGNTVNLMVAVASASAPASAPAAQGAPPDQKAAGATYTAELALNRISVYHDSGSGGTDWSFEIFVDGASVLKLPGAAYEDGRTYRPSARATARASAPNVRIRIVGTRLKEATPLSVEGSTSIPVQGDAFESTVHVAAKSGDPRDGEFLFVLRVTPSR